MEGGDWGKGSSDEKKVLGKVFDCGRIFFVVEAMTAKKNRGFSKGARKKWGGGTKTYFRLYDEV